jgi:hypothetical protein
MGNGSALRARMPRVGSRIRAVGVQPPATPSLDLFHGLVVQDHSPATIELLNPDIHAGAEVTEAGLVQSVALLEESQGFPNHLACRAITTTGDAFLHELLESRCERDVHENQYIVKMSVTADGRFLYFTYMALRGPGDVDLSIGVVRRP